MNKLELLYKMAGTMKAKEKVNGTVNLVAFDGEKQFANITNNFKKDSVTKMMSIDVHAVTDMEELKIDKSIKKDFNLEELHQKHHHGHKGHCHGKRKCGNKFAKLEMMFKVLKDMEVSELGNLNVVELDIKEILDKKKEKMKNHEHCHNHEGHKAMENCELMDLFKIKHAIFKELMSVDFDKVMLKLTIDEDYSIKEVNVEAIGAKKATIKVTLNY